MARVPLVGRLFWHEYIALVASILLVLLENLVRIITLGLPQPVIRICYRTSRNIFNLFSSSQNKLIRSAKGSLVIPVASASDFVDLCALFEYHAEEHIVHTRDGYLLGVHRLCSRRGEKDVRVNAGKDSIKKPVVYLHHGLLMSSEVWVCITEEARCLAFRLVEGGYDVWLGNNRGNKYSKKSTQHSPSSNAFWNFSMDEFAFYDIPDTIDYILATTFQPSLSYIGFSQGTAQAFAALSTSPQLNEKVAVFIGLAPAMAPAGLKNGVVDALVKASPEVLFLAFGRRIILSSATMWQSILYPPIFVRILDMSLSFLFNWSGKNISPNQKLAAYPHLYSFTSTKSVVHWFQIIRTKQFQMYDDDVQAPLSIGASNRYYKVARFPTRNIKTPIVLVYGGSDSLVDIDIMLKELPRHTTAKGIPHFEHLDFLWGQAVDQLVFPHIFSALKNHTSNVLSINESVMRHDNRFDSSHLAIGDVTSHSEDDLSSPLDGPGDSPSEARALASRSKGGTRLVRRRSGSLSSLQSTGSAKHFRNSGITLGASSPTTSLVPGVSPPKPKIHGRLQSVKR